MNQNKKTNTIRPILAILFLILLATVLAVGCAIWDDYREKIMSNQKNQLLLNSRILAENMELSVFEYQKNLEFLSSMLQSHDAQELYCAYLEKKNMFKSELFLEDAQGEVIKSVQGMNLKNPLLLTQASDRESIWMYEDETSKKYLVFKNQMESGEYFCLAVDEEAYYQQLISRIQIGTNGYIVIKNSEGLILMHPEKEQWGIHVIEGRKTLYPDMDYSSLESMIEEQSKGGEGISEYYSYWWLNADHAKVKKISAYASADIGRDFWTISAVVDYNDFYTPIENGFRRVSLLFIGTMAIFILLSLCVGKLLLDRRRAMQEIVSLRELNERLEEIHQGEEMIAHQQRLQVMGTMTGGIAHEFNNFLTPIMGYSELLMMELPEDSEEYESAREIYEASEKAKDVIRQISALSRRNVETVYKRVSVEKLLNRVMKMMESICPVHVHLEKEFEVKEEYILGNATQINQVLLNICVNAVHAIGKKEGRVKISARCVEREVLEQIPGLEAHRIPEDWSRYLQIDMEDNGCGMDAETLRQIFTPFFTTKKAGEGTGLGLALAEQIVTSHRGYIYAESQMDKGSAFHIFFPVMEKGTEVEVFTQSQSDRLRLVIADDNAKILKMLEKNFARLNLAVATCRTKGELQEILEREHPDVLVIDESMEDGSGIDFCMAVQGKYPEMCKIIMADCFTEEIVEAKQKRIIDWYLAKPVSDTTILEAVRSCRE